MALNTKMKTKILYNNKSFYWFVRIENTGEHRIHILSEDKKFNKTYQLFDTEVPVTPSDIIRILQNENL